MPLDRQLFPRDIAGALAELIGQRARSSKQIARSYDIDPSTAENLRKGHLSLQTLLKIAIVEGRDLWEALGDSIYGETLAEHEERRLQQIIKEADHARERLVQLRARREALDSRAADAAADFDRTEGVRRRGEHG